MGAGNPLDPLGDGDQEESLDPLAAGLLEHLDGCQQRTAGGEHRVDDQGGALLHAGGEFFVVGDRFQRLLVAVESHHADPGAGDHVQDAVHHPQAGTQDRHYRDLLPLDLPDLDRPGPAGDGDGLGLQVLGCLVGQQPRDFGGQFAALLGAQIRFAQQTDFMLDQGVLDFVDGHGAAPPAGGVGGEAKKIQANEPQVKRLQAGAGRGQSVPYPGRAALPLSVPWRTGMRYTCSLSGQGREYAGR
ncbi:protein of unknown function [Trichlorobacter ammonificans]|uniref:Uncharacterized protein n=1 Tax=Trichlorobacter ammonificans TaxID=2916410 RepID=A0ABM9D4F6_9BACT|nr:protein of unknown function [Trichlorobacter ammonificans]